MNAREPNKDRSVEERPEYKLFILCIVMSVVFIITATGNLLKPIEYIYKIFYSLKP